MIISVIQIYEYSREVGGYLLDTSKIQDANIRKELENNESVSFQGNKAEIYLEEEVERATVNPPVYIEKIVKVYLD